MNAKRFLSVALTLAVVLGALSGAALAADWPLADSDAWSNLTLTQAEKVTGDILRGNVSQDVILVYYSEYCGYSEVNVPLFVDYAARNGLTVKGYDHNSEGALTGYFRLSKSQSVAFPAVVIYNSANRATLTKDGVRDLATFQSALAQAGLTSGDASQPEPEPEPSETSSEGMERQDDASISAEEWEVLRLTNIHRGEIGALPLSICDEIQMAGNQRAYEQLTLYAHDRPDGSSCFTALSDYQVGYSTAAENIAMGYRSAADVVNGWLDSSGHRKNIENPDLTHIGIGENSNHWVQIFAGSSKCAYSGLSLSQSDLTVPDGDLEAALAEADVTVGARCASHGACTLPLTAGMCSGYDPDAAGAQKLTVTLGDATTTLTVTVASSPQTPSPDPTTPDATDKDAWGAGWDDIPAVGIAYASTQKVEIDGTKVQFEMYALKDANGNDTNYIKVRDLAYALQWTEARFNVEWNGNVCLSSGAWYDANGSEFDSPFWGDEIYQAVYDDTMVDGVGRALQAIRLVDNNGGGYTYYKLRDLGRSLGFNVDWSAGRGVFIETDKPYKG